MKNHKNIFSYVQAHHKYVFVILTLLIANAEIPIWNHSAVRRVCSSVFVPMGRLNCYFGRMSCLGHGGIDPGKVGVNNALEKDINLAIALKLERNLRENGINVVMTRTDDNGLYEESDSNKKVCDMKNRLAVIEEAKPVLAVSIHQNSYPDASVSGVQVFYYKDSVKSKEAAEIMQDQLIESLKPKKERAAKENSSYYLLKKTSVPIMIIECAFMSNPTEAQLLTQEDYQEKVAWAIYMGIMQIVNANK